MNWFHTVKDLTEMLVSIRSVSNEHDPSDENRCAAAIAGQLMINTDLHPELLPLSATDKRANVFCLLHGTHPDNQGDTVILLGHFDTVPVIEFVSLGSEDLAFHPDKLHQTLRAQARPAMPAAEVAARMNGKEDAWMFGRGVFDMKSGIAVNIAVIRMLSHYAEQIAGNILFVACPDEENESAGILAAVSQILDFAKSQHLNLIGAINTDYTAPRSAHEGERYIYTGTIGKLLPSFYVLGDTTHVGEPFRGVDASQIAAQLVSRINLNPTLADRWQDGERVEVAVPPITLKMRDLKSEYNVQTANEAYVYVNWLTYTRTPGDALNRMVEEAHGAVQDVLDARQQAYQAYIAAGGEVPPPPAHEPRIYTFDELCDHLRQMKGWSIDDLYSWQQKQLEQIKEQLSSYHASRSKINMHLMERVDNRERSRLLVAAVIEEAQLKGPAVVVYFAPPYYPHIQPQENRITQAVREVMDMIEDNGTQLGQKFIESGSERLVVRGFYPYISDMSYLRIDEDIRPHLPALMANMPLYNTPEYRLPLDEMQQLNCPVVNIGPWGKDAHGLYERVYTPYSFEVLPQIVYDTVMRILSK